MCDSPAFSADELGVKNELQIAVDIRLQELFLFAQRLRHTKPVFLSNVSNPQLPQPEAPRSLLPGLSGQASLRWFAPPRPMETLPTHKSRQVPSSKDTRSIRLSAQSPQSVNPVRPTWLRTASRPPRDQSVAASSPTITKTRPARALDVHSDLPRGST